jgi:hypothetical protein
MLRQAVQAEREGQWRVADFWWRELDLDLPRLTRDREVWAAAAARIADCRLDADELRTATLWAVFLAPVLALFAGRIGAWGFAPSDRALRHAARARSIAGLVPLEGADRRLVFGWTREIEIAVLAQCSRKAEAIRLAKELAQTFPDHGPYHDLLVGLIRRTVDDELATEEKAAGRAKILKTAIDRMSERLRARPADLNLFAQLGYLQQARAIALTNADDLPGALAAAAAAQILLPEDREILALHAALLERTKSVQDGWKRLQAELGTRRNASLTAEELALKKQAERMSCLQAFEASAEAAALRNGRQLAIAKASSVSEAAAVEPPPETRVPRLASGTDAVPLRHPPVWTWFRSRQTWDVRLMAAATVVLVVAVSAATGWDAWQLSRRDKAYADFQAATAAERPDSVAMVAAAEAFLASRPLAGTDPRTREILDGLGRALTLRLLSKPQVPNEDYRDVIDWARRLGTLPSDGGRT